MTQAWSLRRGLLGALLVGTAAVAVCAVYPRRARLAPPLPVGWAPDSLQPGAAAIIVAGPDTGAAVGGDTVVAVAGTLAGEPLRFERGRDGRFRALGAIPVNAAKTIPLPLSVVRSGGDTTHQFTRAPVKGAVFAAERLRLPAQFVTPPDSLRERLEEERRTIRAGMARAARTPRLWRRPFGEPLPLEVTGAFGTRREINRTAQSRHLGVDLAGSTGTPVRATNRSVVVVAGRFYYQGNAVYLDHGNGLLTSYMHLSRILVSVGDTLEAGQVIGLVGATGRVTGPHLHWTAYFGRILFDPLSLLSPEVEALTTQW
ncbi:MAG: M23 family metallopeptidase [Gemmatimonadetes bacterium]|nr:M23 family metallopeptidase [Gemmatimonadota bacterium]